MNDRILVISDMHIPYHHPDMLDFFNLVKETYDPTRVVCVGDEVDCFPKTAEVLTPTGFKLFSEVVENRGSVLQYEDGKLTEVIPEAYIKKQYNGNLLRIEHSTYLSETTPKHTIVKENPLTGELHRREAWDTKGSLSWYIPRAGVHSGKGVTLADEEIQLQVAYQADGTRDKGVKWEFSKDRKKDRLRNLLQTLDIEYNERVTGRETTVFYIPKANVPTYLGKTFDPSWLAFSKEQRDLFINELSYWDGCLTGVGIRYTSTIKENRDFVQALAVSSGYQSSTKDSYVDIHLERVEKTSQKSATFTDVPYNDYVYCVQVPSQMLIVRQEGKVNVTGNCHAMSFHDSDPDLLAAGDELEASIEVLKEVYEIFPKVDLVDSNHGSMAYRKGKHHGIPRKYLKGYNEVLDAPKDWVWHNDLVIKLPNKQDVYICHGSAKNGLSFAQKMGMSTIQGHYHTEFNVQYTSSPKQLIWSMMVGCLIDDKSMAFHYNKVASARPIIGMGIIIDSHPMLLPMVLDNKGNWIGELV